MPKAILAFSGGLDTSFCIPYLQDKGFEVITVTVDTGGFSDNETQDIHTKSKKYGAIEHCHIDAKNELYEKFVSYIIKANYLKGGVYPACVGPERVIAAMKVAHIAKQKNITTICHGSTGAGNDQIRFDLAIRTLLPNTTIIAPIREHGLTREAETDFLRKRGFEVSDATKEYSINVGLLGTTIGGKETLDSHELLPDDIFPTVVPISKTPDTPEKYTIRFEDGLPEGGLDTIKKLNTTGAKHGFGKDYHIGTTIVGLKGRIGFEAPALKTLIAAHQNLEKITLTSKQQFWKKILGNQYGEMIHDGLYFDPVIKDIEAFLDSSNQKVTGEVIVEFFKGNMNIISLKSPNSLMKNKLGAYGEENKSWDGRDAEGFGKIYGFEGRNAV